MINPFYRNIAFIRSNAAAYFSQLGFELLGFEGADASLVFGGYGWFQVTRKGNSTVVYTVSLRKQGDGLKWTYDRAVNPEAAVSQVVHTI